MYEKNYQAVFWDWNGTLLNDTFANIDTVNLSLAKRGLPLVTREFHAEHFGFPIKKYYEAIGFDFSVISYDELADEYNRNYLAREYELKKNAKRTLEKLFLNSVKQYILSASEKTILNNAVKKYGLEYFFTDLIALDNVRAGSKLEVARAYLRENRPEGKILMVGDTDHDVEVAEALGMDCVVIDSGNLSPRRLRETGKKIITDLYEVVEIVLGTKNPPVADGPHDGISEANRRFSQAYHDFYDDVKNTNKTEDW